MAVTLDPGEREDLQAEFVGQLFGPGPDRRGILDFDHFLEGIDKIGAVHHGNPGDIVPEPGRVGILPHIRPLPHLLDDVLFDAELRAVKDVDLEAALCLLINGLRPIGESLVIGFLWTQDMVEFQDEFLLTKAGKVMIRGRIGNTADKTKTVFQLFISTLLFKLITPDTGRGALPLAPHPSPSAERR